ncbi:MAG: hypothetical protein E7Z92_04005 [Cyanobacteria bacterium SIG31]|nr:hypothetical protein [Cyanobacteria bacterium SIG31]
MYSSYENYQYNSCISRGICSINPRITALQTIIVLYLRLFANYANNFDINHETQIFILNTISITIFNPDFNEDSFLFAVKNFKTKFSELLNKQNNSKNDFEEEKATELFKATSNIIDAIKFGEKVLNRAQTNLSTEVRDLYNIMLLVIKNLSINLLELEEYDQTFEPAFEEIVKLLSSINIGEKEVIKLKSKIVEATNIDNELMALIRESQEEKYGYQEIKEVSFSTSPSKAVLVVGSNIRELENILETLKNEEIDVYTHDDMMLAHTFPKFSEYPKLKGQFGLGLENCLLDFATFPGPIILTKNSLHNIENLYRGRLFTTDYTSTPKGVLKIENNDFSQVIESAYSSKGFKKGKKCESITIGYNYKSITKSIQDKIDNGFYEHIFIIGLDNYSLENRTYFEKIIKKAPKNVLIISFSYSNEKDNLVHINSCFDYYSLIKIFNYVRNFNLQTTVFIPKCERHSISQMIYLSNFEKTQVYINKCTPIILNPSLMNTLKKTFDIKNTTLVKKDLEEILL